MTLPSVLLLFETLPLLMPIITIVVWLVIFCLQAYILIFLIQQVKARRKINKPLRDARRRYQAAIKMPWRSRRSRNLPIEYEQWVERGRQYRIQNAIDNLRDVHREKSYNRKHDEENEY